MILEWQREAKEKALAASPSLPYNNSFKLTGMSLPFIRKIEGLIQYFPAA